MEEGQRGVFSKWSRCPFSHDVKPIQEARTQDSSLSSSESVSTVLATGQESGLESFSVPGLGRLRCMFRHA